MKQNSSLLWLSLTSHCVFLLWKLERVVLYLWCPPIVWLHICFCLCSDSLPCVHICSINASAEVPGKARGPRLDLLPTLHVAGLEHIPGGSLEFAEAMMGGKLSDNYAFSK